MAKIIRIKKGLDIPIKGAAPTGDVRNIEAPEVAISPEDFPGFTWRLLVKTGDIVKIGSPLLADKETGKIKIVAPLAGKVKDVVRGERRKILYVIIEREGSQTQADLEKIDKEPTEALCGCGLWAFMRQRPYGVIPTPGVKPRDIFITAFDSAPLAGEMIRQEEYADLESGIKVLSTMTDGKVYLATRYTDAITSKYAEVIEMQGPHPAGNVGVQIAAIRPVNKGETVWAIDARTVARIGAYADRGVLDFSTIVTICGTEAPKCGEVKTEIGASLKSILENGFKDEEENKHIRVIAGNVLTGIRENPDSGFLRYPYRQVTLIPEGDDKVELLGWASMSPNRYSVKRSFPAFLEGAKKKFDFDARFKGGHRAMILSGEYDSVFPFDIYPEYLVKAAIANDIDKMEKLGIYEVVPEDFALPEFVDSSNIPLQQIIRNAIDYMRQNA